MQLATWGTYRFKADAQKCADEIMEICEELESATPQQILEKARDGNTELHVLHLSDFLNHSAIQLSEMVLTNTVQNLKQE